MCFVEKNGAKDWFTGTVLSSTNVGPSHKLELHHIFPKALLKNKNYEPQDINDLANMAFLSQRANRDILDSPPVEYLKNIDEERLKAQYIPVDKNLWELNNFKKFLDERRKLFAEAINKYLKTLGGEFYDG